ncbi:MAG: guanylate kinase [Cyclobacteriaceae bacterium]
MPGKAIIFSAPSGSGKTTLVQYLLKNNSDLDFSISATTRSMRAGEVNGVDYYFFSPTEFKERISTDSFVEWEEVYGDLYYGTLKSEIERIWDEGKNVIFDVDVQGGVNLKSFFGEKAISIFVKVPSLEILKRRLVDRGSDTPESLAKRLEKMEYEMSFEDQFDSVILNDDLDTAKAKAQELYDHFK